MITSSVSILRGRAGLPEARFAHGGPRAGSRSRLHRMASRGILRARNGLRRCAFSWRNAISPRILDAVASSFPRANPMLRRLLPALVVVFAAPASAQLPPDKALEQFKVSEGLEIT